LSAEFGSGLVDLAVSEFRQRGFSRVRDDDRRAVVSPVPVEEADAVPLGDV
jgi:hypothetical protein